MMPRCMMPRCMMPCGCMQSFGSSFFEEDSVTVTCAKHSPHCSSPHSSRSITPHHHQQQHQRQLPYLSSYHSPPPIHPAQPAHLSPCTPCTPHPHPSPPHLQTGGPLGFLLVLVFPLSTPHAIAICLEMRLVWKFLTRTFLPYLGNLRFCSVNFLSIIACSVLVACLIEHLNGTGPFAMACRHLAVWATFTFAYLSTATPTPAALSYKKLSKPHRSDDSLRGFDEEAATSHLTKPQKCDIPPQDCEQDCARQPKQPYAPLNPAACSACCATMSSCCSCASATSTPTCGWCESTLTCGVVTIDMHTQNWTCPAMKGG